MVVGTDVGRAIGAVTGAICSTAELVELAYARDAPEGDNVTFEGVDRIGGGGFCRLGEHIDVPRYPGAFEAST